MDTLRMSTSH